MINTYLRFKYPSSPLGYKYFRYHVEVFYWDQFVAIFLFCYGYLYKQVRVVAVVSKRELACY